MQLMSISGATRHLGYKSRSQLHKLIDDGCLDDHLLINMLNGQRLWDVDGLQDELQSLCQWRIVSVFLSRLWSQQFVDSLFGSLIPIH